MSSTVKVIPIKDIQIKSRFRSDMGDLSELAGSIKAEGLISPIAVKATEGGFYNLLAGYRRIQAYKMLEAKEPKKWSSIPARIYPAELPEISERAVELEENIRRKGFEWTEEVALKAEIHRLQVEIHPRVQEGTASVETGYKDLAGWRVEDTAKLLDKSRSSVASDLRLAEALEIMPELKKYKTKQDAMKILSGMGKMYRAEKTAVALKKKQEEYHPDDVRTLLTDSYHIGNFLEYDFKDRMGFYDFINFDPPYAIDIQGNKKEKGQNVLKDAYNEIDKKDYEEMMRAFINRCYSIMSSTGWIVVWHSPEYMHMFYHLLTEAGFDTRMIPGVWVKDKGQTNRPDVYLASTVEFFLYARKGKASIVKQGRGNSFIYKPVVAQRKRHITEKPIELMEDIMSTFVEPGRRAFSPCLGSGNDILAAVNIGVFMEGTELTKEFKDLYVIEVHKAVPPNYKSYKE